MSDKYDLEAQELFI